GTAASRLDISKIDLGTTATGTTSGGNWLQFPNSVVGRNTNTGVCLALGGAATGNVLVAGDEFTTGPVATPNSQTQVNCAGTGAPLTKAATFGMNANSCTNGAAVGKSAGTTVTAWTLNNCN